MLQQSANVLLPIEHQPAWDFYCCEVDERPAIISLDLNLADGARQPLMPYMVYLSIKLTRTSSEGFPLPSELSSLCRIEDQVLAFLLERTTSAFCGRVTTNGCRDFIFYTKNPSAAIVVLKTAMRQFENYTFETGWKEDPEWDCYFNFLFPNERELNNIFNQRRIEKMEKTGQQFAETSVVRHKAVFSSIEERDRFILHAIDEYFKIESVVAKPFGKKEKWEVVIFREEKMVLPKLNSITGDLLEVVKDCNGIYEGWEV